MKTLITFLILVNFSVNLFGQYQWEKHPNNPIMTRVQGEWDAVSLFPGTVLYYDGMYHMWYGGSASSTHATGLGYATSTDGITWIRHANNPLMVTGDEGQWDDTYITDFHVVRLDTIFHMWYTGDDGGNIFRIGHATSPDGLNWTKDPVNPVRDITGSTSDNYFCFDSPVVYDGNKFHMYFSTGIWHNLTMVVNHALSEDGYSWTLDPENPILVAYDKEDYVTTEYIFCDGERYFMSFLRGYNYSWVFNIATSEDLYLWEEYGNNPVFSPGPSGSWDEIIGRANILYDSTENKYRMWYMGGTLENVSVGYAESSPFVEIPDTAFLYALIDKGVDADGDSLIHYEEAEEIAYLDISNKNISDMTGIETFFNLDTLYCDQNQLTSLDVSGNHILKVLGCDSNQLTSLDVSDNTELGQLVLAGMPTLNDVCVWEIPFPPAGVDMDTTASPNAYFTLDCWDTPPTVYDTLFSIEENSPRLAHVGFVRATDPEKNLLDFAIIDGNTNETFSITNSSLIYVENAEFLDYESIPQFVLTVVVTEREGPFSDTAIVTINVTDLVESIRAYEFKNKITIHPNPASGSITIGTGISGLYDIEITSLNGQLIFRKQMEGTTHQINLSSFRKGVYFITIRSNDCVCTRKIIKQ